MIGTEMVPETSVSSYNELTRLIAREEFIDLFLLPHDKPHAFKTHFSTSQRKQL
jgi:hypothetical protein